MIDEVVPLLAKLCNASLNNSLVPSAFKKAKVRPLFNEAGLDQDVFRNYWPVTSFLFLQKIFEKIVLACLIRHLISNGSLEPSVIKRLYGNCVVETGQ